MPINIDLTISEKIYHNVSWDNLGKFQTVLLLHISLLGLENM